MISKFSKLCLLSALLIGMIVLAAPTFAATTIWGTNGSLKGSITNNGNGTITAYIENSGTQAKKVGVASYYKYVNNANASIPDQELFDYASGIVPAKTGSTPGKITFTIRIPNCSTQVDVFVGDVIYTFTGENDLYGSRKIVWTHINTTQPCDPGDGDEGCTPGYWKNHNGFWSQKNLPYVKVFFGNLGTFSSADTYLYNTLSAHSAIGQVTINSALSYGGNRYKFEALLRASSAALLSASHPQVDYPLLASQVVARTRTAWYAWLAKDYATVNSIMSQLDTYNNLGCDLGRYPYP